MEGVSIEEVRAAGDGRDGGRGWGGLWILVGLSLIAYPLSVGPVAKLLDRGLIPEAGFRAMYRPLGILCDHSPLAVRFFRWYLQGVWGAKNH